MVHAVRCYVSVLRQTLLALWVLGEVLIADRAPSLGVDQLAVCCIFAHISRGQTGGVVCLGGFV